MIKLFIILSNIYFINSYELSSTIYNKYLNPYYRNYLIQDYNMPTLYTNISIESTLLRDKIYSIEHIYPKSYLNNDAKIDMHNLIKTTKNLNNVRSNYKFYDENILNYYDKDNWIYLDNNIVNHKRKIFIPTNKSRGIISRAILYMLDKYNYNNINKVIDYNILIEWYKLYPPSKKELYHNSIIKKIQNTNNKFISDYKYIKF